MTTVRTICTRALRRSGLVSNVQQPSAEDMATAKAVLNEMVRGWKANGVDILLQANFELDDEFTFWVPPLNATAEQLASLSYQGTWNASTNSPALASSAGTIGYAYRVSTAGSTTLDDVTSWAVNDWAFYTGVEWLKGFPSTAFDGGIIAMLAFKIADEFGTQASAQTALDAREAWRTILPYYAMPPLASFDTAITDLPSRESVSLYSDL